MSEFNNVPQNLSEEFAQEVVQEVMNPDTDCPVCYVAMESTRSGENCVHVLCEPCFQIIINTTNKCPICREDLVQQIQQNNVQVNDPEIQAVFDEFNEEIVASQQFLDTIDYDDLIPGQREMIFEGDDLEPTEQLFNGRKWFDVTTQELKIWINDRFFVETEVTHTHDYYVAEIQTELRRLTLDFGHFNTYRNCPFCGIQRTKEANKYLLQSVIGTIPTYEYIYIDMNFGIININTQYCWGTNAFDGQGLNCCLSCWLLSH
jgi:hypothetical protein